MKEIGKIVSVHGVNGDVVVSHFITNQQAIPALTELMVEVWDHSFIPFFIEYIKGVSDDDMVLKFEEINSREEAKMYLNKRVYVFDEKSIQTHSEEEWGYLTGFAIFDKDNQLVGEIENVISNGMQILLELTYKGKIIHLPLHEDLIIDINRQDRKLQLIIPEGLLDIWN